MSPAERILNVAIALAISSAFVLFAAAAWYTYQLWDTRATILQSSGPQSGQNGLLSSNEPVLSSRIAMGRIATNSCGLAAGLAMAFLAMALFLLGVQRSIETQVHQDVLNNYLARVSAGAFVMLCSTAIIIVCLLTKPERESTNARLENRVPPEAHQ